MEFKVRPDDPPIYRELMERRARDQVAVQRVQERKEHPTRRGRLYRRFTDWLKNVPVLDPETELNQKLITYFGTDWSPSYAG